jgi:hypothetical protein
MIPFLGNIWVAAAGYAVAGVLLWLLLEAKEDLGAEIAQCNTDKVIAIAEAERLTREAMQIVMDERVAQLEARIWDESNARRIAEEARVEAESRLPEVRTIIREVASENACIDTTVPDVIVDSLR